MSILSDYQRHVEQPRIEAYEARVAKLVAALQSAQALAQRRGEEIEEQAALWRSFAIYAVEECPGGLFVSANGISASVADSSRVADVLRQIEAIQREATRAPHLPDEADNA